MKPVTHKIASLNPEFVSKDGFYAPVSDEVKVHYTNAAEEQVIAVISGFDDCSSDSLEVDAMQGSDQLINNQSAQILHAFDFSQIELGLEISNDYGNISRLLGEKISGLESLKTKTNAAKGSAYRCADMANVSTICAAINDVELPAAYYDFILLTGIEEMVSDEREIEPAIRKISKSLKPGGVIALVSSNPNPVSAWFSDQKELPYQGLYGLEKNRISQSNWIKILSDCGMDNQSEQCFLPNARNAKTLLSKDYLHNHSGSISHFYGAGMVADEKLNEYLLFQELAKSTSLFDLCDNYLTLASSDSSAVAQLYSDDFTHFSSSGRNHRWRTHTRKRIDSDLVEKQPVGNASDEKREAHTASGIQIRQDLSPQPYREGASLAGLWLEQIVGPDGADEFERSMLKYHRWLIDNANEYGNALYDILPFNLIVDDADTYQVIDPEWQVDDKCTPEFVLFRALFWFGFHNRHLLSNLARKQGLFSLEDFVLYGLSRAGYQSDVDAFSAIETDIQSSIEKQFNQDAIAQTLRLPINVNTQDQIQPLLPRAQVFWYEDDNSLDFENSVSLPISIVDEAEIVSTSLRGLDTQRKILRIDPVDRAGFFHFHAVILRDADGKTLWSLDEEGSIANAANVVNAVYCESNSGSLFIAQNDDPQFIFELPELSLEADSIELKLSYTHSKDYNLAMQQLGQETVLQKQFISQQRNELESLRARNSELNDNFDFLKNVSEDQHELIEKMSEHTKKFTAEVEAAMEMQAQQIVDQQGVIDAQLEMMQRTPTARLKNFVARLRGQGVEEEPAEAIEEEVPAEPEPVVAIKPEKLGQTNEDYEIWIENNALEEKDLLHMKAEIAAMPLQPKFSIVVPVYDIDEEYLMLAINSVRDQIYPFWELCLVDDASPKVHIRPMLKRLAALDERIVVRLNRDNKGIAGASNDAVKMTSGDYVALLDHDDEISIDALYQNAKLINENPDLGFIYSDEDKVTMDERRVDPFFKPDYSPDLLDSQNYICHFSVISQKVIDQIGGFNLGFDGSQDHDIIMRAIEHAEHVAHIPRVLYHWRKVPGSTAEVYDSKSYAWEAGRKAVEARLSRSGQAGHVELGPLQGTYQVKRDIMGDPKVSIIIPFKDRPDLLRSCLDSILKHNDYENFEVIGVSNNSEEAETQAVMESYQSEHENIRFVEKNVPFNFSQICNFGVAQSDGDYVLLLNNDIEIRTNDWLERLLEHAQRPDVGAVGGKLFFPDGRIQHAGVVAGMHGAAGHSHLYFSATDIGYYGSLMVTRNGAALTGAMLMVSRAKYDEVGGLDEQNLAVAYNDVDLCLSLLDAGYLNIYTPFVHAVHHESASRGYEDNPEKIARLEAERSHFLDKWEAFLDQGDPYFNPNFDLSCFDFSIQL